MTPEQAVDRLEDRLDARGLDLRDAAGPDCLLDLLDGGVENGLPGREALAQALQDFEGTLIVVAHDRHLLEATTDQWWLVADGTVAAFDGDLDDYREWSRKYRVRGTKAEGTGTGAERKAQKRSEAESRRKLADAKKPFEKKIQAIERELAKLQPEKETLDAWLGSGEAYEEAMRGELAERSKRHGELAARIAQLEEDWLWNSAAMEAEVNRARD